MENTLKSPLLCGNYPDPTIIRVGDDYYMATSSFEVFPGIPMFHSRDLANWTCIGNALDRESQLYLAASSFVGGIMAPTLRWHNGVFYLLCCNFSDAGNFIVSAKDPAGPWSEPVFLPDVPGIDASLFFDDDGRCYIQGTGELVPQLDGSLGRGIYNVEFDIEKLQTVGEKAVIWDSALHNAASPEAPHLYHIGDWYYLIIAEGGTERYHAVTVARSRTVNGWYEGNPANPVLTHRHLGQLYPICNAGHADLVQTQNGDWYAVFLASRLLGGYHKPLGRESFICPVSWEDEWPVFNPGLGAAQWEYPAPAGLPAVPVKQPPARDTFEGDKLRPEWIFWGTPTPGFARLQGGRLLLAPQPRPLARELEAIPPGVPAKRENPGAPFIGRRMSHFSFSMTAKLAFAPAEGEAAGLAVLQAMNHQLRLERVHTPEGGAVRAVRVSCRLQGLPFRPGFSSQTQEQTLVQAPWAQESMVLAVRAKNQVFSLWYGADEDSLTCLAEGIDGLALTPASVDGMTGGFVGLFATGNGRPGQNTVSVEWFEYLGCD